MIALDATQVESVLRAVKNLLWLARKFGFILPLLRMLGFRKDFRQNGRENSQEDKFMAIGNGKGYIQPNLNPCVLNSAWLFVHVTRN